MSDPRQGENASWVAADGSRRAEQLVQPIDVLIVEDSQPVRHTVAEALRDEGYEVLSVQDGVDALRVLEQTDPWLLLLDLQLPRLDGRALLREIRERRIPITVIVMTGTQNAQGAAREMGADGYLAKPFNIAELSRIAELHRRRSA